MILVDANLLLYAHVATFPQHEAAGAWLDGRLNGTAPVGLPWSSLLAFARLVSNPRMFEEPETLASAWEQVDEWLDCPPVWIPQPTDRHRAILGSVLTYAEGRANLVPDAYLAALAIEHGLLLCSSDGDFARFPNLRWENPLKSSG
jgi:toxin-antitoxin system PIN domain toxin